MMCFGGNLKILQKIINARRGDPCGHQYNNVVAQNTQTMTYNPNKHHRRSVRLKGYDYSQTGLYYITICVQNRACLFGKIENGNMILNDAGHMIENEWLKLTERFKNIVLHEYVIMPNHFHAILEIVGANVMISQNNTTIRNENGEPNLYTKGQHKGLPLQTVKPLAI